MVSPGVGRPCEALSLPSSLERLEMDLSLGIPIPCTCDATCCNSKISQCGTDVYIHIIVYLLESFQTCYGYLWLLFMCVRLLELLDGWSSRRVFPWWRPTLGRQALPDWPHGCYAFAGAVVVCETDRWTPLPTASYTVAATIESKIYYSNCE